MLFNPNTLSLYPDEPGVYLMKNESGDVLYIGKAKNLRLRLKQYFSKSHDEREMIPYLISQIKTIDTIVVLTEKDALLLENNLIKQHKPKYNVLLKDDKAFINLVITHHKWPMIRLLRFKGSPPKQAGTVFGPYTSALAARQTFDLMAKLFPLRQCSDQELANRTRPCLLYDIKRCLAPCVKKCTEEEYQFQVDGAKRLLKGQDKEVLRKLKEKMQHYSENLEFEKAHDLLKMIHQIEHVTQVQHVDNQEAKDLDVLTLYREATALLISQLLFREGKIVASEHFSFNQIISSDEEILESFLLQHYKVASIPSEILVSTSLPSKKILEEILSERAQKKVTLLFPQKGKKQELIEMGLKNAKALFKREQDTRALKEKMLLDLADTLKLSRFPRRIECFDTSNISGTNPVASLVSFVHGEKDKSQTRLFKIKGTDKADDYTAMKEVLYRHFLKEKEKKNFCDLLIVDGGKGQLNLALEVFEELGIASIDVIALTKENARHDKGLTQEKVYIPHQKEPLWIDPKSPLLFLLQKIRDEAHLQAISYHRKKRSQATLKSALDNVKGIGPIKKKKLLSYFGSVKALLACDIQELDKVEGLNKKDKEILKVWIEESNKRA
jgi:excinuclease ABC subunit C